jgi:hypothetical protein
MIHDRILRAIGPFGPEVHHVQGTIRYKDAAWGRVILTLPKRVAVEQAINTVAMAELLVLVLSTRLKLVKRSVDR